MESAPSAGSWMRHSSRVGHRDSLRTSELAGKRMLLLGFGRIAQEVARRGRAFGMELSAFDPFVSAEGMESHGVRWMQDWRDHLGTIDVLSIHVPLSSATRNIVDAATLAALKPTAIVLNTARGGLLDEAARHRELSTRMTAGAAGLDTFAVEPPQPDNPLLKLPNVVVSPHSASLTGEAARRMGVLAARNVLAGLDGTLDPELVFNPSILTRAHAS